MPQKLIDIKGCRFEKLTVIEYVGNEKWRCKCDCGNETFATGTSLRDGKRKSCGCDRKTNLIDLSGKRFGRLTVIERDYSKKTRVYWFCKCDCGNVVSVSGANLGRNVNSCGCLRRETTIKREKKHGKRHEKIYGVWCTMKSRCYNKNVKSYKNYGLRGIQMCEYWKNDFETFYNWSMESGYAEGLEIDRIDNNKGYSPDNCRWITKKENMNNTRQNVIVECGGETHTISEWSDISGTKERLISQRLKNGWSEQDAIYGKNSEVTKSS